MEKSELSYMVGMNVKWYSSFGKQSGSSSVKHRVTILSNLTSRHIPYEMKTHVHENTYRQMFIEALLIKAKSETTQMYINW